MPENEDRQRFLTAFGLGFCVDGQHATPEAFLYDNVVHCPQHLPPGKARDKPVAGRCQWQRGHWADAVWQVPLDGRHYCASHLHRILSIAWWKP